jgi:hypothetical protein
MVSIARTFTIEQPTRAWLFAKRPNDSRLLSVFIHRQILCGIEAHVWGRS